MQSSPTAAQRKRCYIVSVGTSLISKANDNGYALPTIENDWKDQEDGYQSLLGQFLQNGCLSAKSAELSTLYKNDDIRPRLDDKIVLVHTDTTIGRSCAKAIKEKLSKDISGTTTHQVDGLSDTQNEAFFEKGLPNLLHFLHTEIVSAREKNQDVILVPTGGYKAIIPYYVIAGILYDCPCIYVYEDSDLVVKLPPLPLHVDLARWSTLKPLVDLFHGKDACAADKYPPFQKNRDLLTHLLLETEENGQKRYQANALCETLAQKAEEDIRRPVLQFRTLHSPLLTFLETNGNTRYRDLFERLASIGPHIWKGDRVPEMADHALLHHADLFSIAERLLLPIFLFYQQRGKSFLSPLELLVLLGALHLHDCGHVIGKVHLTNGSTLSLYPTEIRDHHHVLGYLRLTEPDHYQGTEIRDTLTATRGVESRWEYADIKGILKAMAVVGLFHRKPMKFRDKEGYRFIDGHPMETVHCLEKFLEEKTPEINGSPIEFQRYALLVSLLRIIDCLDEQGSRTGGEDAVRFHEAVLLTEAQEEEDRAERLKGVIESIMDSSNAQNRKKFFETIDKYIAGLVGHYAHKEKRDGSQGSETGTPSAPAQSQNLTAAGFRDEIGKLLKKCQMIRYKALVDEYLMSKIRAAFKRLQKEHFSRKLAVQKVEVHHDVRHTSDGAEIHFTINLLMDETVQDRDKIRDETLKGMEKEYCVTENVEGQQCQPVKKVLNEHGIFLEFKEAGETHGSHNPDGLL